MGRRKKDDVGFGILKKSFLASSPESPSKKQKGSPLPRSKRSSYGKDVSGKGTVRQAKH